VPPIETNTKVKGAKKPNASGPRVTEAYGLANSRYASGRHTGIDYAGSIGDAVNSVANGVVISIKDTGKNGYGKQVLIKNADGTYALYGHLSGFNVTKGQKITAGQHIAALGDTGNSTGPHLHFEIRRNANYGSDINPTKWLSNAGLSPSSITNGTRITLSNVNSSTGSTGGRGSSAASKSSADWASQYGVQAALVESTPELKALFDNAVKTGMSTASFQASLMNTKWFTTHGSAWRIASATAKSDPGTWAEQEAVAKEQIAADLKTLGVTITDSQMKDLTNQSLFLAGGSAAAIDSTWLTQHIIQLGNFTGQSGQVNTQLNNLKNDAASYGLSNQFDDRWYTTAVKNVLNPTSGNDYNFYKNQMKELAKGTYTGFAKQLDAGMTMDQISQPYVNLMANTLEMDPNTVSLMGSDKTVFNALTKVDANGQVIQPGAFLQQLKTDNRYFKTQQSHQEMADLASNIAQTFGRG
jgi:hypothetical protein